MRWVIFGLSVSSSWGNGHASLWRGLMSALARSGHAITFFEWDAPYYAPHRDYTGIPGGEVRLYPNWEAVRASAAAALREADVAVVTSYCPHGVEARELLFESRVTYRVFYDLDTPVTLELLRRGETVPYLGGHDLSDYDLVLSFTGGVALNELQRVLGARRVAPLYGSVDPALHGPAAPEARFKADLSYLGTYAEDRQPALDALFLEPARRLPQRTFALAGSQYPQSFPWTFNLNYHHHVVPAEHSAFYCSARLNLNITRKAMMVMGYCPSGRLFEAAACGAPLITDQWEGLDLFYQPGEEILLARDTDDVMAALSLSDGELSRLGKRARERTLDEHTNARRAEELVRFVVDTSMGERRRTRAIASDSVEV